MAIGMGQQHGMDLIPGGFRLSQPLGQLPWAEPGIKQQAKAVQLQQACVSSAAAGQGRKLQRHPHFLLLLEISIRQS